MKTRIAVAILALIYGSFWGDALDAGPAVDSTTAVVDFEHEGFGEQLFDVPLSRPLSMERISAAYVGAFVSRFHSSGGRYTVTVEAFLVSQGEVVGSAGAHLNFGLLTWASTGRTASFVADAGVIVDAIRFRHLQMPEGDTPAADLRTRVHGLHEGNTVQVHFVRGALGPENMREASYEAMDLVDTGTTEWQESYFVPVPGRHLRLLFVPSIGLTWWGFQGSTMTEAEFILDDGSYLRMDDLHSPPTGELDPGRTSRSHFRLLDEATRARLEDIEVIGWRVRLVREGEGWSRVNAATKELFFIYDYTDCNENDIPDEDERPAPDQCEDTPTHQFRRGDTNGDGKTDITDPLALLSFKFLGADAPGCDDSADANDDGVLDIADAVTLLSFLFVGDVPLSPPVGACGPDPTDDALDCETFGPCEF